MAMFIHYFSYCRQTAVQQLQTVNLPRYLPLNITKAPKTYSNTISLEAIKYDIQKIDANVKTR